MKSNKGGVSLFVADKAIALWQRIFDFSDYQLYQWRRKRFHLRFQPDPTDVYVVSHMKSGTTWTQMIMFQLFHGRDLDLEDVDHIEEITPWYDVTVDIDPHQFPRPLVFKSHETYGEALISRPGKYIYVMRNGMDVALSYYHHMRNYFGLDKTYPQFFDDFISPTRHRNWFDHVAGWLKNSNNKQVLSLRYEDLHADFEPSIQRVAQFCGLKPTDADLERVRERSNFKYMKEHWHKFGIRAGDKTAGNARFLRLGKTREGVDMLSVAQKRKFAERFDAVLGSFPEVADYRPEV